MEGSPMMFEASITIGTGGVTARLMPADNRVEIEVHNTPTPEQIEQAMPRLMQHLAERSRLPVRHEGRCYYPRPLGRHEGDLWGDGEALGSSGKLAFSDTQGRPYLAISRNGNATMEQTPWN
jgi:hypothetical protein